VRRQLIAVLVFFFPAVAVFAQLPAPPCGPGTYNSTGSTASGPCIPCPIATYAPIAGATACIACTPGSFGATVGSDHCTACAAGTYSATAGSMMCVPCAAQNYAPVAGMTACFSCPNGWSTNGTTCVQQTACPPGMFIAADSTCRPCPADTYSSVKGANTCTACPSSQWTSGLLGQMMCSNRPMCVPGTYSSTGFGPCLACAPGTFQPNAGSNVCYPCKSGYTSLAGSISCTPVP
jgi:hypothetical protein